MGKAALQTRMLRGHVVAELTGELDTVDAEFAASAVRALTAEGRPLIIDLEFLDFIDCHATGALLGVRKATRLAGSDILLAAPHGSVQRLLDLLEVDGVYVSVSAAAGTTGPHAALGRTVSRMAVLSSRAWPPRWPVPHIGPRG